MPADASHPPASSNNGIVAPVMGTIVRLAPGHPIPSMTGAVCIALGLFLAGTATAAAGSSGNPAAGREMFEDRCVRCHTIDRLAGLGDRVRNDMRYINEQMSVLGLLWDEEVADLRAFLNSVKRPDTGSGKKSPFADGQALEGRERTK